MLRLERCMWCFARFGTIYTKPATLWKLILLHGCFSRFLICTNATKLRNASQIWLFFIFRLELLVEEETVKRYESFVTMFCLFIQELFSYFLERTCLDGRCIRYDFETLVIIYQWPLILHESAFKEISPNFLCL